MWVTSLRDRHHGDRVKCSSSKIGTKSAQLVPNRPPLPVSESVFVLTVRCLTAKDSSLRQPPSISNPAPAPNVTPRSVLEITGMPYEKSTARAHDEH